MKRHVLDAAMRDHLAHVTGKEVGLVTVPSESPAMPYAILYPIPTSRGTGSYADPEENRDYRYQVTCVGKDPKQAAWMSSRVEEAMVGRSPSGYLHDLDVSDIDVIARWSESLGSIVPSGRDLFESTDTYTVRAGAN